MDMMMVVVITINFNYLFFYNFNLMFYFKRSNALLKDSCVTFGNLSLIN